MAVVTIGELVVDWIATEKGDNPQSAGMFYRTLGGNAANVAVGVARLGASARLIAKIGDDIHQKFLLSSLTEDGVDISRVTVDANYPTAQCYCYWDRDDDYSYYNWPKPHAADMLHVHEIVPSMFDDASIVHVTGISLMRDPRRSAILRAIEMTREMKILLSFDACFPTDKHDEIAAYGQVAMNHSAVLKVNLNELDYWFSQIQNETDGTLSIGPDEESKQSVLHAARRMYSKYEPALLAVTLGEHGSLMLTESEHVFCPPHAVKAIAPVGAGDGYIAGLLTMLSSRFEKPTRHDVQSLGTAALLEIGTFANGCGALVTTKFGASDGMPTAQEVRALLQTAPN